ncbi:hypothetical protein A2769_04630 [Candidatus Daviesbacteria bacterium RIFCSPHIGHO2_01_FULL_37_27]|nr:MAG: hypothetical protein A2769_04630 [Candidatus Daviesbacteria bacterium RIFCSPHIGHO2_01_FULL_37_27]OGE46066.1 MAG: hypothetical protein A3B39_03610 [Candidatus Daviesbacteria bacterium RIFCSPLOWO2_01_FULL_37_10]
MELLLTILSKTVIIIPWLFLGSVISILFGVLVDIFQKRFFLSRIGLILFGIVLLVYIIVIATIYNITSRFI